MWAVIIGIICYAFNINPVSVISGVAHGIQTMRQTNAHG
jgi:choline-glycine betaine transporter